MPDDVDTSWVRSVAGLQSKLARSNDYRTAKDDRGELIRPWANPADPRFDNANKLLANITASFPDSTLEERLSLVDNGMRVGEVIKGDDGKPKLTTVILTAEQKRIANALYNGDPQAEQ